jgi:hypothetical protein
VGVHEVVDGLPSYVEIHCGGIEWNTDFSTTQLGKALLPGTYTDAQWFPYQEPNHPGFDVSGEGRDCGGLTGQFTVVEMSAYPLDASPPNGMQLKSFTAYFELRCHESDPGVNYGCVHYQP